MSDSADKLRRLQAACEGQYMPPDLAEWLAAGISKVFEGSRLDESLGITPRVGRWSESPHHRDRIRQRNGIISILGSIANGTRWQQSEQVSTWLNGYNMRQRSLNDGLPSSVRALIEQLHRHDPDPPRSCGHIYRILTYKA